MNVASQEHNHDASQHLYFLYHELRAAKSDYLYAVDKDSFEKHIDLFSQIRTARSSTLWPEITFDDGHASDYEIALPILQSRGIQARFFITAGWTGVKAGYMDWSALRALLQAGQIIGAHGWSHTLLTHCDGKSLHTELVQTRSFLEDKLGTSITSLSLPGGRLNRRVLKACLEAGYTQIFTSSPKAESLPLQQLIGRVNIRGDMKLDWIAKLLELNSPVLSSLERQHKIKMTAKSLLGDGLYEKVWAAINRQEKADK